MNRIPLSRFRRRRLCSSLCSAMLLLGCASSTTPTPTALQAAQILPPLHVPGAPAAPQFAALDLPDASFASLGNGIRVGAFPSTRAPYVQMQLQIDAGRMLIGSEADVLAEMLRLIGHANSLTNWQQGWRELGASLSVRSGSHRLIFSAEVLPDKADALLDNLLAMWRQPNLVDPAILQQAIRNLRTAQRESDLQGGDAERLWQQLAYGREHAYGKSAANSADLHQISIESLQQRWQNASTEAQQWLFAGAFTRADLARWQGKLAAVPPVAPTPRWRHQQHALATPSESWQIHLLDAPGAAQVTLRLGFVLPLQQAEQRWQCEAVATVLGNNSGRLFRDLREQRGLSYDPNAHCSLAPLASALLLTASTRPEHSSAMLHGLRDHLRLLQQQPLAPDELALVQSSLRGSLRMQLETARQRSSRFHIEEWLGSDWHQLGKKDDYWQQLSGPALQQFAASWLQTAPITVVRGDADQLQPQLRRAFPDARLIRHDTLD